MQLHLKALCEKGPSGSMQVGYFLKSNVIIDISRNAIQYTAISF
jgi:hypothetical protein